MRMRFYAAAAAFLFLGCSDAAIDAGAGSGPSKTEPQPPRAVFTMRDGSNTASDGATLSLSTRRGELVVVTLDASLSSTPGSTISSMEWRINGEIAGHSMTMQAPLAAASTPYQVEFQITNAANASARATGTISVAEIVPTPVITSIDPSAPKSATSPQMIVVNGSGFLPESRLTFTSPMGTDLVITPTPGDVLATAIVARIALATAGAWSVQVVNPGGVRSNTFALTVDPVPPPRITAANPSSVLTTGGPQTIELVGLGFQTGLRVSVTPPNGNTVLLAASDVLSVSESSVRIRVDFSSAAGAYAFVIRNPDDQISNVARVDATAPAPAVITGVTPSVIIGSASPQLLTILGSNFNAAASVALRNVTTGQTYPSPTIVSRSSSQIVVSHTFPAATATWAVDVTNPNATTASFSFSVGAPPPPSQPVIIGVSPNPAMVSTYSQKLIVTGTGFTAGMTVDAIMPTGGTAPSDINAVTPTSFELWVILRTSGTWSVRVRTPSGTSTTATFAVKYPTPVLSRMAPTQPQAVSAPQSLFLEGDNFDPTCTVTLRNLETGQTLANLPFKLMFDAFGPKQLEVLATLTTTGTWTAQVVNPGNDASPPRQFTVVPPVAPVVLNLSSPNPLVVTALDQQMFISGANFVFVPTVTFISPSGATVTGRFVPSSPPSSTTLLVYGRFDSPGTWRVQVTNPGGLSSSAYTFSVGQ